MKKTILIAMLVATLGNAGVPPAGPAASRAAARVGGETPPVQPARTPAFPLPIGIAAADGAAACVAFTAGAVATGALVTVVFPEIPQRMVEARLGARVETCKPLDGADIAPPYYALTGLKVDDGWVGIAIAGKARVDRQGRVTAEIDGRKPRETFRWCPSMEGLHLTVWSGRPLHGKRLWHGYYYLGYDVEPSCTDGDV